MAARITQQRTEIIRQGGNTQKARMTQEIIEHINRPNNLQNARLTQIMVEVIMKPAPGGFVWNPFTFS